MSSRRLRARCPAKVNLMLRVLSRRADGFHELDTIFQTIDLWDTLEIAPGTGLALACDDRELPVDETNLVLRAVALVGRRFPARRLEARLRLSKSIPVGAGLGGGSSDAAGALRLCSAFWGLELDEAALVDLAAELGSDVPFFLTGGTARGRGRGERIELLPPPAAMPLLLGCPPFGISTDEVFRRVASRLTLPRNGVSLPCLSAHKWPEGKDFGLFVNDLERVVFADWPELLRFRDALLDAGARMALLSGSGSTVYGIFAENGILAAALGGLRSEFRGWRLVPTRTVRSAVRLAAPEETARGTDGGA